MILMTNGLANSMVKVCKSYQSCCRDEIDEEDARKHEISSRGGRV